MSSFFNSVIPLPEKPVSKHPWESRMKPENLGSMKYAHNSTTSNLKYPNDPKLTKPKTDDTKPKQHPMKNLETNMVKDLFTVIGIKFSKEFIYCRHWVQILRRYRSKRYEEPVITGVTTVEWPKVWNDLKLEHHEAYCVDSPVVVLLNGVYLGGHEQLKEHLENIFNFHFYLDYRKESLKEFSNLLNSTNRPFVYMHFSVDDKPLGTMIFMLYTDIVPLTCENFMRLCRETRGGYAGTPVHRIVKDCWIQCGGFGLKDTDMKCENFILDFDKRGVLGMANAERHIDCSTQFFVISQPAHWMKERYVAFGQLIDGESTFKAIEESPTWYESPTQNIKIYKAGVINMECQYPMTINKNTREYVTNHIENLHELGEYFYELIMEKVSNAILLDYLKNLESAADEGGEEQVAEGEMKVKSVDRFVHKKPDTVVEAEENNDFDVDSYVYEPEEYDYDHVSVSPNPSIKPDVPFYMALTDVPYPGEVDSDFDMKRFIRGKYSLKSDVKKNVPKLYLHTTPVQDPLLMENSASSSSEESSLGSEGRREYEKYLREVGEKVCVSGNSVKKIAKSLTTKNILQDFYSIQEVTAFSDEELRKARLLDADMKISKQREFSRKIVSLTIREDHAHHRIRRRPTGFLREEDLVKIIRARVKAGIEHTDINSSDDSDISFTEPPKRHKKVVINHSDPVAGKKSTKKEQPESTLFRLYSDFAMDEGEKPTLKDYRSTAVPNRDIKANSLFLTVSEKVQMSEDSIDENKTIKQEKTHQSLHKRMMEAAAVEERAIQIKEKSIRSHQFAKTRPSLTVKQYLEKNRSSLEGMATAEVTFGVKKGLRLPGDSPLYSAMTLISIESKRSKKVTIPSSKID